MNLLAFDTSTELLSVAVQSGQDAARAPLEHSGVGGAQASASLIPSILALMARAGLRLPDLDAIAFGCGPGSFTGLRTACSVAQGLAFGCGVPVLAVDTLLAVAEEAHYRTGARQIVAVLDARMDELYSAAYLRQGDVWQREGEISLGGPQAVRVPPGWALAGNGFVSYGDRLPPAAQRIDAAPTAAALLRLAPALLSAGHARAAAEAIPLYIRDKVAQTIQERAASRAATNSNP